MSRISLPHLRGAVGAMAIAGAVGIFALLVAAAISQQPLLAVAVPVLAIAGVAAARWPATTVTCGLALSACFGTLIAYDLLPAGVSIDLVLAALWLSVLGSFALGRRERPWWVWPGIALVLLYIVLTFFEIFTAIGVSLGLQSFKYSTWYLMCVPLLAFADWKLLTYQRISRALVVVALLVGAYAVLRLIIGPSGREATLAYISAGTFNTIGDELSLIGSFPNRHELAFWATCAVPISLAAALITKGMLWRVAAVVAVCFCFAAAFGTDVRAALPAMIAGSAVVVGLNLIAGRGRGSALAQTAVAAMLAAVAGAGMFAVVVGEDSNRYEAIVSPSGDTSYEAHTKKWESALQDLEGHPFGLGLATAGRLQEERATPYLNAASYAIDSAYLKIAYEQGFPVLALFVAAMIALLVGLARRAVRARDPSIRGLSIGACGALAASLSMFLTGQYLESPAVLLLWIAVGAAAGALAAEQGTRQSEEPSDQDGERVRDEVGPGQPVPA